ncbi:MAG: ABC transporter permease [Chloroflexi bacterium]|nr:ABC transporter permease [Chloroflexota bacterium]
MVQAWIGISLYELYVQFKPQGVLALLILDPFIYLVLFIPSLQHVIGEVTYGSRVVDYAVFALPGILTMTMLTVALAAGFPLYMAKTSGEIEMLFSSPSPRWMLLGAKMQTLVVRIFIEGLVIFGLGLLLVSLNSISALNVLLSLLLATGCGAVFGLVVLSLAAVVKNDQVYSLMINLFFLPLVFTAPVFYPIEQMPAWLQIFAKLNPLTFAVAAIRGTFFGIALEAQLVNLIGLVIFLVAAIIFARWAFPKAIQ